MTLRRFFPLIAQPAVSNSPVWLPLQNPSFEYDLLYWTQIQISGTGNWQIRTDKATDGYKSAWFTGSGGGDAFGAFWELENATKGPVSVGDGVTAQVDISLDTPDKSESQGKVRLHWFNASDAEVGTATEGVLIHGDTKGAWHTGTVTGYAPSGATYVKLRIWATANAYGGCLFDNARWARLKDGGLHPRNGTGGINNSLGGPLGGGGGGLSRNGRPLIERF